MSNKNKWSEELRRMMRMIGTKGVYKPSRGDLRFRDAMNKGEIKANPFEKARLLRGVSHDYLSVLAASNSGEASQPFRSMIDAELSRRNSKRATHIAIGSLAVAIASLMISAAGLMHTGRKASPPPVIADTLPTHPQQAVAASSPVASEAAALKYPRYVTSVPVAFRGRWDEIVADKCAAREARFKIDASSLANFEVVQDVERVKLYNPTEIAITTSFYDDDKNEQHGTWEFKLVDDGKTLTGRKVGTSLFHKCSSR